MAWGFFRKNVLPLAFCGSLGLGPQPPEIGVLGDMGAEFSALLFSLHSRAGRKTWSGNLPLTCLAYSPHPLAHACAHACFSRQTQATSQACGLSLALPGWFPKDLKQLFCCDR